MNRKALVAAVILIAVMVAAPLVALFTTLDHDIDDITFQGPNLATSTQLDTLLADIEANHSAVFNLVIVIEAVCVVLLAVALWYTLKQ
jgi:hypothetical protein